MSRKQIERFVEIAASTKNMELAKLALRTLVDMGDEAVPVLLDMMDRNLGDIDQVLAQTDKKTVCVTVLLDLRVDAFPRITEILDSAKNAEELIPALEVIGRERIDYAIPKVVKHLFHENEKVRARAAFALWNLEPRTYPDLKLLIAARRELRKDIRFDPDGYGRTLGLREIYKNWADSLNRRGHKYIEKKKMPKPSKIMENRRIKRVHRIRNALGV